MFEENEEERFYNAEREFFLGFLERWLPQYEWRVSTIGEAFKNGFYPHLKIEARLPLGEERSVEFSQIVDSEIFTRPLREWILSEIIKSLGSDIADKLLTIHEKETTYVQVRFLPLSASIMRPQPKRSEEEE